MKIEGNEIVLENKQVIEVCESKHHEYQSSVGKCVECSKCNLCAKDYDYRECGATVVDINYEYTLASWEMNGKPMVKLNFNHELEEYLIR